MVQRGALEEGDGQDPLPYFREAASEAQRALEINPRRALAWNNLGQARMTEARVLVHLGQAPWIAFQGAVEAFESALRVDPSLQVAAANIAEVFLHQAKAVREFGGDPEPFLQKSELGYRKATKEQAPTFPILEGLALGSPLRERLLNNGHPGGGPD